ncbi:Uncharacterized protein ChrSV_3924 [Chromobacterium vaccinii]|nr:Uncharacterized protein ChrSW_3924 [Chromobacterium vaccinii]QND91381.1 Uncharacterized protein ChrSV_3924 [Chromobacterium vaccinii]
MLCYNFLYIQCNDITSQNSHNLTEMTIAANRYASARLSDNLADLAAIFDPNVELCLYRRPPIADIAGYLCRAGRDGLPGLGWRRVLTPGEAVDAPLADLPGREALYADIAWLCDLYATLTGCDRVGARLEVLSGAMCPRFHVDRIGLRLLCCYQGPGTEWLPDAAADRARLGVDTQSGLVRDAAAIGRALPFSVLLLKGAGWPGANGGAIHRSPAPAPGEPRVLLALDAVC